MSEDTNKPNTDEAKNDSGIEGLDKALKTGRWLYSIALVDPLFRLSIALILWSVVLFVGQFYFFRIVQIRFFEVPSDRIVGAASLVEIFELFQLFPLKLTLAPVVLLPIWHLYWIFHDFTKPRRGINTPTEMFKRFMYFINPVVFIIILATTFDLIYGQPWEFSTHLAIALVLFAFAMSALNQIWKMRANNPKQHFSHSRGFPIVMTIASMFFAFSSLSYLRLAYAFANEDRRFEKQLCSRLSMISVKTFDSKIGWLIARDEHFITMREKSGGVYRSIDLPTNQITEVVYLERLSNPDEKNRAFPACANAAEF